MTIVKFSCQKYYTAMYSMTDVESGHVYSMTEI